MKIQNFFKNSKINRLILYSVSIIILVFILLVIIIVRYGAVDYIRDNLSGDTIRINKASEKQKSILVDNQVFTIFNSEYGIYTVVLKKNNVVNVEDKIKQDLKMVGIDYEVKLRIITVDQKAHLDKFYSDLPMPLEDFYISASMKSDKILISIYSKDIETAKSHALDYIQSKYSIDLNNLNIEFIENPK